MAAGSGGRTGIGVRRAALALLAAVLSSVSAAGAAESPENGAQKENPHVSMKCEECHSKVPEKRTSEAGREVDFLVKDPVQLCRDCHDVTDATHHPVVNRPGSELPAGLPLGTGGAVICSTCHDVHLKGPQIALLRGFDTRRYSVRMDMCLDCHGANFSVVNPHQAETQSRKCYTCHAGGPISDNAPVILRENLVKVCDFCHNVSAKKHPLNVDPLRKLPDGLPRSKKGEVMCGTCHDPHGGDVTIHFLRNKYVEFLESGRYANPHGKSDYASCVGCHLEMSMHDAGMRKNLRYGGDDLQICLSCHGGMDSCHPILVSLLPGMKPGAELVLSAEGKIKCTTCHDPTPKGGSGVAMRGRVSGAPTNAICYRCHDKSQLSGRNPHATMSDREKCRFCHDTMTDPSNEEAARVSFITNTRLICLRCHEQSTHPAGADHLVQPRGTLPEVFKLDGKGKITCTTCHNPHLDVSRAAAQATGHRYVVEVEGGLLCGMCHKR